MNRAGFFRELQYDFMDEEDIRSQVQEDSQPQEVEIINYLREGTPLLIAPGVSQDVINLGNEINIAPGLLTDGDWVWPSELAYYVANYHIRIPSEFVAHMQKMNFRATAISDDELAEIDAILMDDL